LGDTEMREHTIILDKLEDGFVIQGSYGINVMHRYAKTLAEALQAIREFIGD